VIVSTAVEETVPEVIKTRSLNIPILKRSEVLALIAESQPTIAIGGTSGKSTTSGMLFQVLRSAGQDPSIISGAGLVSLIRQGMIGNAWVGKGKWLIIEADESDGSIVSYHPEIGVLLNIDKDHQEIDELIRLFTIFRDNCQGSFLTNAAQPLAASLAREGDPSFSGKSDINATYMADQYTQAGMRMSFTINHIPFTLHTIGRHNMENALAAVAAANLAGIGIEACAAGLASYEGIYRRHQVLGEKDGVIVIDDYAHNPAKCAASIAACQQISPKVIAWFQPHGYGPTRFLRKDFVQEISAVLRPEDQIWMSEIFYAGGTAVKDISANDLIEDIRATGKQAYFTENREDLLEAIRPALEPGTVLLLMGARDPGLESFSQSVWQKL
jgi:UDP-N-acetylmuramate--alanine ligase